MNFDNREPVVIECPECGEEFAVDLNEHEVGMFYECHNCGEHVTVPELDEIVASDSVNENDDEVGVLAENIGIELNDPEKVVKDYHAYILEHVESNAELLAVLGELYNKAYLQGWKRASLAHAVELINSAGEVQNFEDEGL